MSIPDLIQRLETASGGSRELDAEIVAYLNDAVVRPYPPSDDFGPKNKWQFWSEDGKHFLGNESRYPIEPFTTSLDAALALAERMLPGWIVDLSVEPDRGLAHIYWSSSRCDRRNARADAPTPALSLCLAILRAIESQSQP